MKNAGANVETMLRTLAVVEQRDEKRIVEPDVEFHWSGSLPYDT